MNLCVTKHAVHLRKSLQTIAFATWHIVAPLHIHNAARKTLIYFYLCSQCAFNFYLLAIRLLPFSHPSIPRHLSGEQFITYIVVPRSLSRHFMRCILMCTNTPVGVELRKNFTKRVYIFINWIKRRSRLEWNGCRTKTTRAEKKGEVRGERARYANKDCDMKKIFSGYIFFLLPLALASPFLLILLTVLIAAN